MKGEWIARTKFGEEPSHDERIFVKSQFGRAIKGILIIPNPNNPDKVLEDEFEGYIINSTTIRYFYRSKGNFEDNGVGIFKIESNYVKGAGASVNIGVSSTEPEIARFDIKKCE